MKLMRVISLGAALAVGSILSVQAATLAEQVRGSSWELVSLTVITPDGKRIQPVGPHPHGYAIFDRMGHYISGDVNPNVPNFASGNLLKGTDAEYRAVATGDEMDFGTYSIDEKSHTLVKHIVGSTFPNWQGTDVDDVTEIKGDEMIWRPATGPQQTAAELVWKRMTKKN